MKKTLIMLILFTAVAALCSCSSGGKIIIPFEADLEKHYAALEIKADGSGLDTEDRISTEEDTVILENAAYAVGINGADDALWFYDRYEDKYYDMTGACLSCSSDAQCALLVYRDGKPYIEYEKDEFYDIVNEKYRPSLTAFYTDPSTVRLIYIIGVSQLKYLGEYPIVLTPETYKRNEMVCSNHYRRSEGDDSASEFINEFCSSDDYYYLYNGPLPEPAKKHGSLGPSEARKELLSLGYDQDKALICLFVADVSISDDGITVDISPNRQYRTKGIRTSMYDLKLFFGEIPFVVKTESESEYISFAGSKF